MICDLCAGRNGEEPRHDLCKAGPPGCACQHRVNVPTMEERTAAQIALRADVLERTDC